MFFIGYRIIYKIYAQRFSKTAAQGQRGFLEMNEAAADLPQRGGMIFQAPALDGATGFIAG